MSVNPSIPSRSRGHHQGRELSEQFQELYAADQRDRARIIEAHCRFRTQAAKYWDGKTTCTKSGISHCPLWESDSSRPSGRRLTSLELASKPKYSGTAKDERRCLEDSGMAISDAEVKTMFGRDYVTQRKTGIPHLLFGHQNFNDRAIMHSYLAGAAAEVLGRDHIAFVTELLGAHLHTNAGQLRHDPKTLIRDLIRKYRRLFPGQHILVMGFFENIIREVGHSGQSRARRFIADSSGAPTRQEKRQARSKKAQSCDEDGAGWMDKNLDTFLTHCFPEEMLQEQLAAMYSGSRSTVPFVEVPHVHLLIAVFDIHGEPLPFHEIESALRQAAPARYQLNVQRLYDLSRKPCAARKPALKARNAFVQAARCIKYAIKRSGNLINERDLQFRTLVRGTTPNQGFFDVLMMGKNLVKRSRSKRVIPLGSVLGRVIDERRRLAPIVGMECPNDGEPETIKQIERRLLATRTPIVLADGKARRSAISTVSKSFYYIGKNSGTFLIRGIRLLNRVRLKKISWISGQIKRFRKMIGGGP